MSEEKNRTSTFSFYSLGDKFLKLLPWLVYLGLIAFYLTAFSGFDQLNDFGSFVASGRAIERGDNPYEVYDLTSSAEWAGKTVYFPNLNPPFSLFFFQQLADLDLQNARLVWTGLSAILYFIALIPLAITYRVPAVWVGWAALLAGFWDTLVLGQIYVPLFVLVAGAWLLLRKDRFVSAGILIGIAAAIKPNLFLVPVILFIAGYRRTSYSAVGTGITLSLLPVFFFGHQVYLDWFQATLNTGWASMPHYISILSLTRRIGLPWLGYLLAVILLGMVSWWIWSRKPPLFQSLSLGLITAILASPLATPRFTMLLIPVFFYLIPRHKLWTSGAVLMIPSSILIWIGFQSESLGQALSLLYPFGLILLLFIILNSKLRDSSKWDNFSIDRNNSSA